MQTERDPLVSTGGRAGLCLALTVLVGGCFGGASTAMSGYAHAPTGNAGATPGGAQDIGLAREKVENGLVPLPEDWTVEGILSEHDLPLEGAACDQTLCVDAAVGLAKSFETGNEEAFAQIGFSSNIDLSQFHRRPQNIAAVVDISGSMSEDHKLESVKIALQKMVDQLNDGDLFTLVAFDTVAEVRVTPQAVTDRAAIEAAITALQTRGGTCIECGLTKGYDEVLSVVSEGRDNRVMLFTDALPNVGATGTGEFTQIVSHHADQVGLSAFGVGLDFGQDIAVAISNTRGGNYFFLQNAEKISTVFDQDFDLIVTPLAYDLNLTVTPGPDFSVADVYGIPSWSSGQASAQIKVPTVFLSRNKGAIVVRLAGTAQPGSSVVSTAGGYAEASGAARELNLDVLFDGAAAPQMGDVWFSKAGVRKTVALTNFVLGAKKVSTQWYHGDHPAAAATARAVRDYLTSEANALNADDVRTEATLATKLAALVSQ
jgi:Ca-activated chloride channel family protein